MQEIAIQILLKAGLLALMIGLAVSLVIGLLACFWPTAVGAIRARLDRGYSLRRATRGLEKPIELERHFYRHHRVYGGVLLITAVVLGRYVLFVFQADSVALLLPPQWQGPFGTAAGEFVQIMLWLSAGLALIVGAVMLVRPSALRGLEQKSNTWVSTRRGTRALEVELGRGDVVFDRYPVAFGVVVSVVSAVSLSGILVYWWSL